MSECTHKTLDDHSVKLRPGLRQWRCSHCERDFFWGPDASVDEYGKAHTLAEFRAWVEAKKDGRYSFELELDDDGNYITTGWEFS